MMNKLIPITLAAVACLLVATGDPLIKEGSLPCSRLSNKVAPTKYELELEFPSLETETYSGHVNISLRFPSKKDHDYGQLVAALDGETCKAKNSNTIVLHADPSIELLDVTVMTGSSSSARHPENRADGTQRSIRSIKRDSQKQLIAIKLWRGMGAGGVGQLSISFRGKMSKDQRGVYLARHKNRDKEYKYIVSQFQPTFARTVFPAFDEPRFKVPFDVRIVHPVGLTALGNVEVKSRDNIHTNKLLLRTTFKQTPPMAVHMVAFTVGQFDEPLEMNAQIELDDVVKSVRLRVFTGPGKREAGRFALGMARDSLVFFAKHINVHFPLDKLDIVAIADLERDNAESWGLAYIRDSLMLIDAETETIKRMTAVVNVAHVCVHQWFGNLISVAWWKDLWITEGVAAQFALRIVRSVHPEYQSEYLMRLAALSGAMQSDASGKLHALSPPLDELRTSKQICKLFDQLEFMKSASLAEMLYKLLGSMKNNLYQMSLTHLVLKFQYGTFNHDDYLASIDWFLEAREGNVGDIEAMVTTFTSQPGVPLFNAWLQEQNVIVYLEYMADARKFIDATPINKPVYMWDDMLVYRGEASVERGLSHSLAPTKPLTKDRHKFDLVKEPKFVKIGLDPDINTYYRTRYSNFHYDRFCEAIRKGELSAMDRLQILNDATALVDSKLIGISVLERLVNCYADENHGAVLIQLLWSVNTLKDPSKTAISVPAIMRVFEEFGFSASGEVSLVDQSARQLILKTLIAQGNQQVIEAALKAFDETQGNVALFLREPVYVAIVAHGSEAQMKVLLAKMRATESDDEKMRISRALLRTTNNKYLVQWYDWLMDASNLSKSATETLTKKLDPAKYLKLWMDRQK